MHPNMTNQSNNKELLSFLKYIFCVVKHNSPYQILQFLHILITAALTKDFVNNTTIKFFGRKIRKERLGSPKS